MEEIKIKKN